MRVAKLSRVKIFMVVTSAKVAAISAVVVKVKVTVRNSVMVAHASPAKSAVRSRRVRFRLRSIPKLSNLRSPLLVRNPAACLAG